MPSALFVHVPYLQLADSLHYLAEHRLNPPIPQHLLPDVRPDGSLKIVPERHRALREELAAQL